MRPAVISDEISQDFDEAVRLAREWGAEAVELRGAWGTNVSAMTSGQLAEVKSIAGRYDMPICGIASPFFKCDLPGTHTGAGRTNVFGGDNPFERQMDILLRCCRAAVELQAPLIRIFAFWRQGDPTEACLDAIAGLLQEPMRMADEFGVILVLENEHACMVATGEESARLLTRTGDRLKLVWDPGNAFAAGETPYPNGYEACRRWIAHVHVKDAVRTPKATEFVEVGAGTIPYGEQFAALRRDGYAGYLSLETHYRGEGLSAAESSRRSLMGMRRLLES